MRMNQGTLRIPFTSQNFPSGTVPSTGALQLEWNELLWAAITVGRPNTAYVFRHGNASYHEAMFRLSLVRMALQQSGYHGLLHRTEALRSLDITEKGAVSYFLGMAVCKLFSSHLLNAPWLLHLDVFREQLRPSILRGRSRPDLVGEDVNGAWHAFECKGRSSVPSAEDKRKAKAQAQRLVSVNGTACSIQIAAITYFRQDDLEFHWRDPDPVDPSKLEPIDVTVPEDAWQYYYGPALALSAELPIGGASVDRTVFDIDVEIHGRIRELLEEGQWAAARSLALEIGSNLRQEGFQPDGIKVTAGDLWRGQLEAFRVDS